MQRVPIPGSERRLDGSHVRIGDVDLDAPLEVSVYLAHRSRPDWVDAEALGHPAQRRRLTRDEWAHEHGADAAALDAVVGFAGDHGLRVLSADPARRRVRLGGSVGGVAAAFEARLEGRYAVSEEPGAAAPGAAEYRARSGPITVPQELDGVIVGVFGIDDRPQARPGIRFASDAATAVAYTPPQVARAYGFPTAVQGAGETVAIIELGGGFQQADLTSYFDSLSIAPPTVTAVSVDGGVNSPGTDTDADGEVMLDIEVIGSIAPGAGIDVYFAANTDQGFLDAVSEAVHDTTHVPSVVSISWGSSEDGWTAQARTQMEQILTDAGALGVTVTVAAGDNGSSDGVSGGGVHVDFPASAPHALGCGGTTLTLDGSVIAAETVWDTTDDGATGGGVSDVFALPSYQSAAHVPVNVSSHKAGRGVPDVAGDANPQTGYTIRVDGATETVGGTSAVAPLWAALITLLNQELGAPLGFAQPRLYPLLGGTGFHDITSGSNGVYSAGPGWDACTGLGSPDAIALVAALRAGSASSSSS
jgi:kumamolisin